MPMDLHMHSNYSDGKNTPEEMIEAAIQLGYSTMAITDHVWKTSAWVPDYARHLEALKIKYGGQITLYTGIEAKVLDLEGDIDADHSFDAMVDLVLGSIHRIPKPGGFYSKTDVAGIPLSRIAEHWLIAFLQLLRNDRVDIIAHPLSELKGFGIEASSLPIELISEHIAQSGKILEINVRYNTPDDPVIKCSIDKGVPIVISSDSHSAPDLTKHSKTIREISERGIQLVNIHEYIGRKKMKRGGGELG